MANVPCPNSPGGSKVKHKKQCKWSSFLQFERDILGCRGKAGPCGEWCRVPLVVVLSCGVGMSTPWKEPSGLGPAVCIDSAWPAALSPYRTVSCRVTLEKGAGLAYQH